MQKEAGINEQTKFQLGIQRNFNLVYRVEISTRFSQPEMKFQPGMKILNFPYNRHFFQPGMKI